MMGYEIVWGRIQGVFHSMLELLACRVTSLFMGPIQTKDITAVVITCGESTYEQCLSSVKEQTHLVNVKTVSNIHPLSASLDAALDSCDTKWLLMVDADTMLKPYCIEVMSRHLRPGVGMVVAKLYDKVYGVIGFIRMIDAKALQRHQFRHPENYPYPDRSARDYLIQKGLKRIVLNSVVGTHNPYATYYEAFRRFYGTYRKRDSKEHHMGAHVSYILKYGCRAKSYDEVYYMMAGLVCGAIADASNPRDYLVDTQMREAFQAVTSKDKNYKAEEPIR